MLAAGVIVCDRCQMAGLDAAGPSIRREAVSRGTDAEMTGANAKLLSGEGGLMVGGLF